MKLEKRKKYLQISFNGDLSEARDIIGKIPFSDQILIEAGTPLIMKYGMDSLRSLYSCFGSQEPVELPAIKTVLEMQLSEHFLQSLFKVVKGIESWKGENLLKQNTSFLNPYLVADIKCADLSDKELNIVALAHASAATCLGVAPIETIDSFIVGCRIRGLDSMIDMINVENPLLVLRKLENIPDVVILHQGVDELNQGKKSMPYYQIQEIKGNYDVLVAVAGGDMEDGFFNGADIVIAWKPFYTYNEETMTLINKFLKKTS